MDADVPSTDDGAAVTHADAGVAGDVAASPVVAFEKVSDDASAEGTPLSDAPASTAAERLEEGGRTPGRAAPRPL